MNELIRGSLQPNMFSSWAVFVDAVVAIGKRAVLFDLSLK